MRTKPYFVTENWQVSAWYIAKTLERKMRFRDEYENKYKLIIGDIHQARDWIAWVDGIEKAQDVDQVRPPTLNIQVEGEIVYQWRLDDYKYKTYYKIQHLRWYGDLLIVIYNIELKQPDNEYEDYTFGCTFSTQDLIHKVRLNQNDDYYFDVQILGETACCREAHDFEGNLQLFNIPDWRSIGTLTSQDATQQNILINLETIKPLATVSLLEFLKTGKFGEIELGMSRDEVRAKIGYPPNWVYKHSSKNSPVWMYGDIEFYFDNEDTLSMIFSDHFRPDLQGEDYLNRHSEG